MQHHHGYQMDECAALLGKGRHCVVKLATSTRHTPRRKVAIKVAAASPTSSKEAGILFNINHENVVEIFDYFVHHDHAHIVLALAERGNLRSYVRQRGRLGDALAGKFCRQIFRALAHLHDVVPVAHCDLKSENILVDANEDIKITDFGQAVELTNRFAVKIDSHQSASGNSAESVPDDALQCHHGNAELSTDNLPASLGGSPAYSAPEVLDALPAVDLRAADVWSAGVVAFYMLTAYLPFGCHDNDEIRRAMDRPLRWPRPLRQVSKASRTFVQSVLVAVARERPRANQLLDVWKSI